jgi:hypothetical protein
MRFWRMIDEIINKETDEHLPLILAGTESETVEYKAMSKYPDILEETINGNHSHDRLQDLFVKAVQVVRKEIIEPWHQEALDDYLHIRGANPDRTALDAAAIEEAANQGRIDKLLVRLSSHTTDTVRDNNEAVDRISFPESRLARLINSMALKVWRMSGTVINLTNLQIPDGAPMVARLRY